MAKRWQNAGFFRLLPVFLGSPSVIVGKTEHLIPYLPKFSYSPKDVRFFGDPIDLIVLDGLNEGCAKEIIFIEVKTGKASRLSRKQQDLRDAIRERPIRWLSMRVNYDVDNNKSPISIDGSEQAKGRKSNQLFHSSLIWKS